MVPEPVTEVRLRRGQHRVWEFSRMGVTAGVSRPPVRGPEAAIGYLTTHLHAPGRVLLRGRTLEARVCLPPPVSTVCQRCSTELFTQAPGQTMPRRNIGGPAWGVGMSYIPYDQYVTRVQCCCVARTTLLAGGKPGPNVRNALVRAVSERANGSENRCWVPTI